MHVNATGYENASYIGCIKMHIECTLYQMHCNATLKMRKKASKCIIQIHHREQERECVLELEFVELCGQMVHGSIFEAKPDFDAHREESRDST